jgi:hypothetical protein
MTKQTDSRAWIKRLGLSAWLVGLFVAAQFAATAHAATYGDKDHLHDGHPCIVASLVKKTDDMDVAPALLLPEPEPAVATLPTASQTAPAEQRFIAACIRAPPATH